MTKGMASAFTVTLLVAGLVSGVTIQKLIGTPRVVEKIISETIREPGMVLPRDKAIRPLVETATLEGVRRAWGLEGRLECRTVQGELWPVAEAWRED